MSTNLTPARWIMLCLICTVVYWLPPLILHGGGDWWFVDRSLWSMAAAWIMLEISHSRWAQAIAAVEAVAIIITAGAFVQYVRAGGVFYTHYETLMAGLAIAQGVLLLFGAPWHGLRILAKNLCHRLTSHITSRQG